MPGESVPDTNPLIVRQSDDAVLPSKIVNLAMRLGQPRVESDGDSSPHGDKTKSGMVEFRAQIVMVLEELPSRMMDAEDFELNLWSGSNRPPGELVGDWGVGPVWLEPFLYVIVASHCHELDLLLVCSHSPSNRTRTNLRDGTVHD